MRESVFQEKLIRELKVLFPGCYIFKQDSSQYQGIPDLLVLYKKHWAMLECKESLTASKQPNQEWYVEVMNDMSFAAFICPENKKEIIDALQQSFKLTGLSRNTKPQLISLDQLLGREAA
jgi:hypothetical protein